VRNQQAAYAPAGELERGEIDGSRVGLVAAAESDGMRRRGERWAIASQPCGIPHIGYLSRMGRHGR